MKANDFKKYSLPVLVFSPLTSLPKKAQAFIGVVGRFRGLASPTKQIEYLLVFDSLRTTNNQYPICRL
jgi:hypothetical protein